MKKRHLICNAHIDPIWQWDWQEGASAVLSTFQSAVNLAEKHDYIFCHNEVTVYKYVEEYAPELFTKIQELVKKANGTLWAVGIYNPTATCRLGKLLFAIFPQVKNTLRKNSA